MIELQKWSTLSLGVKISYAPMMAGIMDWQANKRGGLEPGRCSSGSDVESLENAPESDIVLISGSRTVLISRDHALAGCCNRIFP